MSDKPSWFLYGPINLSKISHDLPCSGGEISTSKLETSSAWHVMFAISAFQLGYFLMYRDWKVVLLN